MAKILIPIDNGASRSTSSAFALACKKFNKEYDEMYLVNVYSSWDYLNEEKNAGKMCLSQYERLCASEGVSTTFADALEPSEFFAFKLL